MFQRLFGHFLGNGGILGHYYMFKEFLLYWFLLFCLYSVHQSTIQSYWSTFFLNVCVIFKYFNSLFKWATQCPKDHNLGSNGLPHNPFLCLKTLKNVSHHSWSQAVHLWNIKKKQLRKKWICVNFFNLE